MIKYGREYQAEFLIFDEPIWMFRAIWGTEVLSKVPKYHTLEQYFNALPQNFLYGNKISGSTNALTFLSMDGFFEGRRVSTKITWHRISNYHAYLTFGLEKMEEAHEKTHSQMFTSEFNSIIRKLKLTKISKL